MNEKAREMLGSVHLPAWNELPDFGLYMDQLVTYVERCFSGMTGSGYTALTPAMINNYVKSGLVDRPVGKKYERGSLAQLLMICELKQTTPLDTMQRLLHPKGGDTQAIYAAFCAAQVRIVEELSSRSEENPLVYALEAASSQLLCRASLASEPLPVSKERKKR